MIDFSNQVDFDEAMFQTMLSLGRRLCSGPESYPQDSLCKTIASEFDIFSQKWRLKSGGGMGLIWQATKPKTATTIETRKVLAEIRDLSLRVSQELWKSRASIQSKRDILFAAIDAHSSVLNATQLPENVSVSIDHRSS